MNRPAITGYPVNLVVAGRRCVVVGAGRIAARKIEALLDAGADVHVVAPGVGQEVQAWADAGRLHVEEREFATTDLDDAWLATTATGVPAVDHAVFAAGEERRVWVNSADDPANCSFTLTSVVRQGDLVVTIGTGGRSPALATYLKDHGAAKRVNGREPRAIRSELDCAMLASSANSGGSTGHPAWSSTLIITCGKFPVEITSG